MTHAISVSETISVNMDINLLHRFYLVVYFGLFVGQNIKAFALSTSMRVVALHINA